MPDIEVFSTDPGKEVRTSRGSAINVIRETQRSPEASAGVSVLGVIGTPANDRGVPNVPVLLSGVQDIFARWGGFKAHVGDGAAEGYNGNVSALLYKLLARRVVFQPVDMALKDLSVANLAAVDLPVTVARGGLAFTVEESDDIFSCAGHQFAVGDSFQIVNMSGGTGASVATTYLVKAPVVAGVSFKAETTAAVALAITLDGVGYLRPIAIAAPSFDAYTLPAGTQLYRGAKTFTGVTGANATEVLTTPESHGLVVGDSVVISALTGGAGATAGTYVVATVPSETTLTCTAFAFTTDITAGTLARVAGSYIVRTLEDVDWGANEFGAQTVRVAKVSGTVGSLKPLNATVETLTDTTIITATTATTVPDDTDAAEILLRYSAAMDAFNVNSAGQSATVLITDRTEAGISDALSAHCAESTSTGIFRVCVVAPPVGTTVVLAEATSADGVGRTSLNAEYAIYVHPGFRRRFPLDADNLSAADDYKATFPGQALLAAKMLNVRPEENPTYAETEPFATYGCAELEIVLTRAEKEAHWAAGICSAIFEKDRGRLVGAYRDGIMADGTKIARKRLVDFLSASIIERATPWHKRLASVANQQGCFDSVDTFLADLAGSRDQRISGYELTLSFDGDAEELTIQADVVELGNMDIITIKIGVTASGFSVLGDSEV